MVNQLEQKLQQKEAQYQLQIQSLHKDYKSQLSDKADQITFLREKLSQTVQELHHEVQSRDRVIHEKVSAIKKQREEDLKTFIESKEALEKRMASERDSQLQKYK